MSLDDVGAVEPKPRQLDVHGDRQRYLADANSRYEVSVSGTRTEYTDNFNEAIRIYDRSLKSESPDVCITHLLNGLRTVILRSPSVKHKVKPRNRIPIRYAEDNDDGQ